LKIKVEGRQFTESQHKEAVAFLQKILLDLGRHAVVTLGNASVLLDDHRQLAQLINERRRQ
jgi:hypothetical protein